MSEEKKMVAFGELPAGAFFMWGKGLYKKIHCNTGHYNGHEVKAIPIHNDEPNPSWVGSHEMVEHVEFNVEELEPECKRDTLNWLFYEKIGYYIDRYGFMRKIDGKG